MIGYILTIVHVGLALACMWSTLCRMNAMGRGTRHIVFLEYFVLGSAAAASMLIPSNPWVLAILAVILIRFLFSSKYWKGQQPDWTVKNSLMK